MKNEKLKNEKQRNYLIQPRREYEFDVEYRADMDEFEQSLTKQADAEACDINNIMARFTQTGELPNLMRADPQYGDFSDVGSFQEAMGIVAHANAQFAALDAKVRQFFENDPAKMLAFVDEAVADPKKQEKLVEMGLALPRQTQINAQAPASAASSEAPKGAGA